MPRVQIPGRAEAIEAEQRARELSFLPFAEPLFGFEQKPLTFRHFFLLELAGSPFVCGGIPQPGHVAMFLWIRSPQFEAANDFLTRCKRNRFIRRCRNIPFVDAVQKIRETVDEAMQDGPSSAGRNTGGAPAAMLAMAVHRIAMNYGWDEETILDLPIARAMQYARLIQLTLDDDAPVINRSDRLAGEWLAKLNAMPEAERKAALGGAN